MYCEYCGCKIICEAIELNLSREKVYLCNKDCLDGFIDKHTQNVVLEEE